MYLMGVKYHVESVDSIVRVRVPEMSSATIPVEIIAIVGSLFAAQTHVKSSRRVVSPSEQVIPQVIPYSRGSLVIIICRRGGDKGKGDHLQSCFAP